MKAQNYCKIILPLSWIRAPKLKTAFLSGGKASSPPLPGPRTHGRRLPSVARPAHGSGPSRGDDIRVVRGTTSHTCGSPGGTWREWGREGHEKGRDAETNNPGPEESHPFSKMRLKTRQETDTSASAQAITGTVSASGTSPVGAQQEAWRRLV